MPHIHQLSFPKNLAEQFGRGSKEKYNDYAFSYCRANNPEMQIVSFKGQKQDPFEQGYIMAVYKDGYNPAQIQERRAENKKKKKGKK
jgi:hypothetical protein